MTTLQSAKKYEDLLAGDVEAAPYDYKMLFKGESFFARRRARKRFKLLKSIDPKLRRVFQHWEKAYFVTPGTTVSLGERFFIGWWAYYLNMRALVFTSNRVLLLQIDVRQRLAELVSQVPYSSIASVKSTWNGLCRVKLVNREIFDFQHVPRADRKFLAEFLTGVVQGTNAPFQRTLGVEHLCPHCFLVLPGYPLACPACGGGIKSARKAALLSFLFPGIGDWYLGHRVFAVLEMFGAVLLWLGLVIVLLRAAPDPKEGPHHMGYWITAGLALLLVTHTIGSRMTHHFARKGHHPVTKARSSSSQPPLGLAAPKPKPDLNVAKKLTLKRTPPAG